MPCVLVIDDNVSVLQTLDFYLESEGYTVLQAASGLTGLRLAADHPVDIVMLDIEMPQMSGLTVCETIKRTPTLRHLPILMMTARSTRDNLIRAKEVGASKVMVKPFDLDELQAVLANLLLPAIEPLVNCSDISESDDEGL